MLIMVAAVIPAFFFAIYNKDGVIPAEKFILLVLRQKIFFPKVRLYRTKNMYACIENTVYSEGNVKEGYFGKTDKPQNKGQTGKPGNHKGSTKGKHRDTTRRNKG
jgi:hypothetical protein